MGDILKAYGQPKVTDALLDVIDFDPELGFNPYVWVSRRLIQNELDRNAANPAIMAAYNRIQEIRRGWNTEEMLKGQAFGL